MVIWDKYRSHRIWEWEYARRDGDLLCARIAWHTKYSLAIQARWTCKQPQLQWWGIDHSAFKPNSTFLATSKRSVFIIHLARSFRFVVKMPYRPQKLTELDSTPLVLLYPQLTQRLLWNSGLPPRLCRYTNTTWLKGILRSRTFVVIPLRKYWLVSDCPFYHIVHSMAWFWTKYASAKLEFLIPRNADPLVVARQLFHLLRSRDRMGVMYPRDILFAHIGLLSSSPDYPHHL